MRRLSPVRRLRAGAPNLRFCAAAEQIPPLPGAYLLLIEIASPLKITRPAQATLAAGRYLYAGSAYGPGGLRARISRHMRRTKRCRWHVDQITAVADVIGAWILLDGNECDLVARNSQLPAALTGFGSSDCRRCRGHLLGPAASFAN